MGHQNGVVRGGGGRGEEAANDAVWGGEAEVIGEEEAPRDVRVDRFESEVDRFLIPRVERVRENEERKKEWNGEPREGERKWCHGEK